MSLENKLNITNSAELAREEEKISKKKAIELFESGMLDNLKAGRCFTLKTIHKYLFEDIYYFFGEVRTVNIQRGIFVLLLLCILMRHCKTLIKCHNPHLMKSLKNMLK